MISWLLVSLVQSTPAGGEAQEQPAPTEIVVTGERRRTPLRQTPSSVVVLDERAITAAGADRFDQLLAAIPNLQPGSGEEGVAIRGQDSTGVLRNVSAFLGGTRPRATLQIDGRAISYNEYVSGSAPMWDVERVEIFRSPQTTTQGRNSVAGALFIETNDPTFDWQGRGRAVAGDFRTRQLSALLSGPLVADQLAFRASGDLRLSRMASDMTDAIAGADIDRDDYGVARLKLLLTPSGVPGLRIESTYAHNQSQAPQFEGVSAPFRARRLPVPDRTNGIMRVNADSLTLRAEHVPSSFLSADLTLSLGEARLRRFALPGLGMTRVRARDASGEAIVRWRPAQEVNVLLGGSLLAGRQRQQIDISGLGIGTGGFRDRQSSLGLFGEVSVKPVPALTVTAGLRRQSDAQERFGAVGSGPGGMRLDYDERFSAWLPKVSLAFEASRLLTVGIMAQRAWHPGGVSLDLRTRQEDRFDPERVRNVEAFVRATSSDRKAWLALNLFHNDIKDAQRQRVLPLVLPDGRTLFVTDFVNAPSSRSWGAEGEMGWSPLPQLTVRGGVGLLRTRLRRTLTSTDPSLGKEFQRSPRLSASATVDWQPGPPWRLSASVRHHSDYFSDDRNLADRRIEAATIVDGRAAWTLGRSTLFGYVRNAFDRFEMTYLFSPTFGTASDPREVGIGVEQRF